MHAMFAVQRTNACTYLVKLKTYLFLLFLSISSDTYECSWNGQHPLCGIRFCSGYGMLVLLLGFIYVGLFYYQIFKPRVGRKLHQQFLHPASVAWHKFSRTR